MNDADSAVTGPDALRTSGAVRGRKVTTATLQDRAAERAPDLVELMESTIGLFKTEEG